MKAGEKPGFPRFKKHRRYSSLTFKQAGWKLEGRRLRLQGIGTLKLFVSRPIEGRVKTVTVNRDRCGDWWATFSCDDVPEHPLPKSDSEVGVDLGLEKFLATSDGKVVTNPRCLGEAEDRLRRAQRRVSRRRKGSRRRRKAARTLARRHRTVERARRDFHFKTALDLVRAHSMIAVEDLNVRGLSRGMLAKSVQDAGWSQFIEILRGKAEEAGREVVAVNPSGTSQVCSNCGTGPERKKSLAVRVHRCACGSSLDRDVNAARNILARALEQMGRAGPSASRPARKAAA